MDPITNEKGPITYAGNEGLEQPIHLNSLLGIFVFHSQKL